jgi:hypothetical protein
MFIMGVLRSAASASGIVFSPLVRAILTNLDKIHNRALKKRFKKVENSAVFWAK